MPDVYFSSNEAYNAFISKKIETLKDDIYKYLRSDDKKDLTETVFYYMRSKNYLLNRYEINYKFRIDDSTGNSIDLDKIEYMDPYEEINPTIDDLVYIKLCIERKYYYKNEKLNEKLHKIEEDQSSNTTNPCYNFLLTHWGMLPMQYAS